MLNFINTIAKSLKKGLKGLLRPKSSLPAVFQTISGITAELSSKTKSLLRGRLLEKIESDANLKRKATLLDRQTLKKVKNPQDLIDYLILITQRLNQLPKVIPRTAFRERVREHLFLLTKPFPWAQVLKRAIALTVLIIFASGTVFTIFILQPRPALAEIGRLSIESGVVRVREANQIFFSEVMTNSPIRIGDTIRVEENGTANLAFLDRSAVRLRQKTEISITYFQTDNSNVGESSVRIALLAGKIEANIAEKSDTAYFSIETPTGVVRAKKSKFAVSVMASGHTEVIANEKTITLKTNNSALATSLIAGQTALLSVGKDILVADTSTNPENYAMDATNLLDIKALSAEIDILQIRIFGALADAQNGKLEEARLIESAVQERLTDILKSFGVENASANRTEALSLLLKSQLSKSPELEKTFHYLAMIDNIDTILNHYFVAPSFRQGVPEIEIAKRDNYAPPAKLVRLFAALRAKELALSTVEPIVESLITAVTNEYSTDITSKGTPVQNTEKLFTGMANQPIYISILQKIKISVAPGFGIRDLINAKVDDLENILEAYKGNL